MSAYELDGGTGSSEDEDAVDVEGVFDVDEQAETFPSSEVVTYFGTDFDVHGLVRRLDNGDIVVPNFDPPADLGSDLSGFQRRFVWRRYQMDRFIESLLLGYPVPGIFLVQQPNRKLLVLDGQQRLRTLQRFYHNRIDSNTVFKLVHVNDAFKGLIYDELSDEDRRALDNTFIHATVVKYDASRGGDEAIYQLFERLNTGGTNLYPQEIRVALYHGGLVDFVRDLNENEDWRALYGNPSERLKDQELVLRFLALLVSGDSYQRPLKGFLNDFLRDHRECDGLDVEALRGLFLGTCDAVNRGIGRQAFRAKNQVNAALVDSVMVGVARRLQQGPLNDPSGLKGPFESLLASDDFIAAIARATADEERVERRLRLATEAFATVA